LLDCFLLTKVKRFHLNDINSTIPSLNDILLRRYSLGFSPFEIVIVCDESVPVQELLKHSAPRKRESVGEDVLSGAGHRSIMAPD